MEDEKMEKESSSSSPPRRVVGEYELQEMVGKVTFAEVFRAAHLPTGACVAVNEIDRRRVDDYVRRGILQEMSILGSISHPNTLCFIDTIETGEKLFLDKADVATEAVPARATRSRS